VEAGARRARLLTGGLLAEFLTELRACSCRALILWEELTVRLRRILALFTMIAALLGYVACLAPAASAAPAPATGWVRCANLSPGNPAVDIYLLAFGNSGNPTVLRHVSYGDVSSYTAVGAGQYTVAMRPVGAPASSPPVVSTSFMVSAGTNYTVASLGPATARRIEVLKDQMAAPKGSALVRVIQASLKQDEVTVSYGGDVLARQLAFGAVTSYMSVPPGTQTVKFSASGQQTTMSVTLAAGSVHTIVVLDGASGLNVGNLTDAVGSSNAPVGGAATGFGGMAPRPAAGSAPWLAALAAGLLLITVGVLGLRRSRRERYANADSRVQAFGACASDPGASSRTGLASTGLLGPCEWPVLGYSENHSGNLDDATVKATRCR
jgi:Domain of unknown function (DUF4397)